MKDGEPLPAVAHIYRKHDLAPGPADLVRLLVKYGFNIDAQLKSSHTVLNKLVDKLMKHTSTKDKDADAAMVTLLLELGADPDGGAGNRHETALMNGAANCGGKARCVQVMRSLIAAGAHVNARAHDGWTALMMACQAGSLPEVELLLANGADVRARPYRIENNPQGEQIPQ